MQWSDGRPVHLLDFPDVAWLAILGVDGPCQRDTLAQLVWPRVSRKSANTNLRQRIFRLRKRMGQKVLTTGATVALDASVAVDIGPPLVASTTVAATGSAQPLLNGTLLDGFSFDDSEPLAAWLAVARQRWSQRRRAQLSASAQAAEQSGQLVEAIALTKLQLTESPLLERVHARLIRLHLRMGDRKAAQGAFETCARMLATELGTRPLPQTAALLDEDDGAAPVAPDGVPAMTSSVVDATRAIGDGLASAAQAQEGRANSPQGMPLLGIDGGASSAGVVIEQRAQGQQRLADHEPLAATDALGGTDGKDGTDGTDATDAAHAIDGRQPSAAIKAALASVAAAADELQRLEALIVLAGALLAEGNAVAAALHATEALGLARRNGKLDRQIVVNSLLSRATHGRGGVDR